jgi:hypothetical protein
MLKRCSCAQIVLDYGHRGVSNEFLVATRDPIAIRYNDRSPNENMHASEIFRLLTEHDDCDFMYLLPLVSE